MRPEALPSLFPHFYRASIAHQAAAALRDAIKNGVWRYFLPSEHQLATDFKISRPSVHAALVMLKNEGLVAMGQGRLAKVISCPPVTKAQPMVCVVAPFSRKTVGLADDPLLIELRGNLAAQGIGWDEAFDARLKGKGLNDHLARLVESRDRMCWLIESSSSAIQHWFHQAGVRALVLGSCHAGVRLPSVDSDYRAIGWHAAGCIARLGHRHIAVVAPNNLLGGDITCRDGIADYIATTKGKVVMTEIRAGQSPAQLKSRLDRLLARRPRPTVVFTVLPEITLAVLFHLQRIGLKVPGDISLVSRDTHLLFEMGMPEITRYCTPMRKKVDCVVGVVQSLLAGHPVSSEPNLISPTFIAGETLARLPAE